MLISIAFPGDCNEILKDVQHDLYLELVGYLYEYSRERYLKAVRLLGVETEIAQLIAKKDNFDHRVLQRAHDKIAAYYRYAHDPGNQRPLFDEPEDYKGILREKWSAFLDGEARSLAEADEFTLSVLEAVAYENSKQGMAAEQRSQKYLDGRYGNLRERVFFDLEKNREKCLPPRTSP